jgi:7-cyano-7-deazaguanine synthase
MKGRANKLKGGAAEGRRRAQSAGRAERSRAVCLVSGGLDSAVALAEAYVAGFETFALSFDYGQRHRAELAAAARVADSLGAEEHRVVKVDLAGIGGSALTDRIEVPKNRALESIGRSIPATYVPARNTVFLAVALGWAEILGARDVFLGVNALDYSGYPDCRPAFLHAFERLASVATAAGIEGGAAFHVRAPLLRMTKGQIVSRGIKLGVDFGLTHSCYDPVRAKGKVLACGRCDACQLRLKGFQEAGAVDPILYSPRAGAARRRPRG